MECPSDGRTSSATREAPPSLPPPSAATRSYSPESPQRTPPPRLPRTSSDVCDLAPPPSAAKPWSEATEPWTGSSVTRAFEAAAATVAGSAGSRASTGPSSRRTSPARTARAAQGSRAPPGPAGRTPRRSRSRSRRTKERASEEPRWKDLRRSRFEAGDRGEDRVDAWPGVGEAEGPLCVGLQDPDDGRRRSGDSSNDERYPREGDAVSAKDSGKGGGGTVRRGRSPQRYGEVSRCDSGEKSRAEGANGVSQGFDSGPRKGFSGIMVLRPGRSQPGRRENRRAGQAWAGPIPRIIRTVCRAIDGFSFRRRGSRRTSPCRTGRRPAGGGRLQDRPPEERVDPEEHLELVLVGP